MKNFKKEINELVKNGIIDWETGNKIEQYYKDTKEDNSSKILLFFSIIGAILVGLGIILIIGHNWDQLSISLKTVLAFVPLILSQCLCIFVKSKKNGSLSWQESSALLLFFSVGATIAMISQIYQISGDIREFIFTWMLLCLPIIFLLPSSSVSLLILIGVINLPVESDYHHSEPPPLMSLAWDQLLLYLGVVVYYLTLVLKQPKKLFTAWHHYVIPAVGFIIVVSSFKHLSPNTAMVMTALFSLYFLIGHTKEMETKSLRWNPYLIYGILGTTTMLFIQSYSSFWVELADHNYQGQFSDFTGSWPFYVICLTVFALTLMIASRKNTSDFNPILLSFHAYLMIFIIGNFLPSIAAFLINVLLVMIGLYYIYRGNKDQRMVFLNFGMLLVVSSILARFFEINLSFLARGIAFIIVGSLFFAANYYLIKKSKVTSHE